MTNATCKRKKKRKTKRRFIHPSIQPLIAGTPPPPTRLRRIHQTCNEKPQTRVYRNESKKRERMGLLYSNHKTCQTLFIIIPVPSLFQFRRLQSVFNARDLSPLSSPSIEACVCVFFAAPALTVTTSLTIVKIFKK